MKREVVQMTCTEKISEHDTHCTVAAQQTHLDQMVDVVI